MVHVIKNSEDYKNAIENNVVIVDCHTTWCGRCKLIDPNFKTLAREVKGVEFFKMDVDEVSDVAVQLGIRAMPTFLLFEDGVKAHVSAYREKPKSGEEASASSSVTSR
ncbi:thioredoxin-like protein [Tuber brumale]|nr:thioredoxin-like protein [Tuber brumale]